MEKSFMSISVKFSFQPITIYRRNGFHNCLLNIEFDKIDIKIAIKITWNNQ